MFRQGDIMLRPAEEIPDGLKKVPREDGRIVLAHGEATGHAHVLEGEAEFLGGIDLEDLNERFVRILEEDAQDIDAWRVEGENGVAHIPADVPKAKIEEAGLNVTGREMVTGLPLRHDEHLPFVVPVGEHKVTRQREYAPEAPVWVGD